MPRRILVTGGAGFIGTHLVRALLARGDRVRVLSLHADHAAALAKEGAEVVVGDLLDRALAPRLVGGVERVFHLAAFVRPLRWLHGLESLRALYMRQNVEGARSLAEACRGRVERFVNVSSVAAGGLGEVDESVPPRPLTEYGKAKAAAEELLHGYHRDWGLPVVSARPGTVYGPGSLPHLVLFRLIRHGVMPTFGPGHNRTPLVYIDDLVDALLLLEEKGVLGEPYYAVDDPVTMREMGGAIAEALGVRLSGFYVPRALVDAGAGAKDLLERVVGLRFCPMRMDLRPENIACGSSDWVCRNAKLRALGWSPRVDLKEGMRRTVAWYREQGLL
ncbi:MAG: NAD(P)-dependent oxidoreductase [Elusimicrobiota bacterium]|jgi:nucleoside-diphosphate-sugar epimerase